MDFRILLRALLLISILHLAGAAHAARPDARVEQLEPRIWSCDFKSEALGKGGRFLVVLPEGADIDSLERYPVIYFLHGRGRNERSLLDSPAVRERMLESPCAIVLPRGDDGWYMNSPVPTGYRYADYTDEIIALAESHFPVANTPERRAIGGWSMGGYGSAYTVVRRMGDFRALATIIGLLDFPRLPIAEKGQNYEVPVRRFGSDHAVWETLNPRLQVEDTLDTAIFVVIGEKAFDRQMNEAFIAAAVAVGNEPEVLRLPGGHSFSTVEQAIPPVFDFFESQIAH